MRTAFYFSIISFLISILLIFFSIFPKYQNWNSLKTQISQKELELAAQEGYFLDLKNASQELKKYENLLLKIDNALPPTPNLPEILNFLQNSSSQSGLIFKGVGSITTKENVEGLLETKMNLVLTGSYSSFKNFLLSLEKSARLIEIEKTSFSSKEKEPFDFNLTIKFYSY